MPCVWISCLWWMAAGVESCQLNFYLTYSAQGVSWNPIDILSSVVLFAAVCCLGHVKRIWLIDWLMLVSSTGRFSDTPWTQTRLIVAVLIVDLSEVMLSHERQSARVLKITNDGLTRSGTECFIPVPICKQWASKGYGFVAPHPQLQGCRPLNGTYNYNETSPVLKKKLRL